MRQLLKTIPAVRYCYGQYKLRRYRRSYGPDFARLLSAAPRRVSPLHLANSLNEFEWLVRHPGFPADLLDRLMEPGSGRAIDRAFASFARGYVAEEQVAEEWQRPETISETAEVRLTEYLNRYVTYALRTFAVHLQVQSDPQSTDAIRVARVLGELEGETGRLLDVGCAFVPLAERYAELPGWMGLDLSLPALAIGRIVHGVEAEHLLCGYSEDLPFPDQAFDLLVSSEVLEHTPRPRRMIAEIARVLRPAGKAVLSVPMHIVDFQDGRQHLIGPTDSTHRFQFHTLEELRHLFEAHGLKVERLQSDPHYVFTLRRTAGEVLEGAVAAPPGAAAAPLLLACPDCRQPLNAAGPTLACPACSVTFARHDGVPVLLPRRLRAARLDRVG